MDEKLEFSAEDLGRFCLEMNVPVSTMTEWLHDRSVSADEYDRVKEAMFRGFNEN